MKKYIQFKKQRELGEILGDTFGFLREEFKPLLKTVLRISGPYLLLFLVAFTFYSATIGHLFDFDIVTGMPNMNNFNPLLMFASLVLFFIAAILAYTFASSSTLHYVKSYIDNEGIVNQHEVKQNVKNTFWSFVGLGFLKWIVLGIAIMLCFFPFFYFIVPMTIVFSILVFEKRSASDAFSYSFQLIKDNFWITLITIIVIGIIVMVASYAFSIPVLIYTYAKMGIFSGEIDPGNLSTFSDPVYLLLNVISNLVQFLLNLISVIAGVFIYFNLNEKHNFTGTFEAIERLGNND